MIFLLSIARNFVASVGRGFLFLLVPLLNCDTRWAFNVTILIKLCYVFC